MEEIKELSTDKKLEYQTLRGEYSLLAQMIATTVTFSIGGIIAIFSFLVSKSSSLTFPYYFLPLLIIFPSSLIIFSRLQSIIRLSSYITVFLEPNSELKYETRYLRFSKLSKCKITFSTSIIILYFCLLLIDIVLFSFNGFRDCCSITCYFVTTLIYLLLAIYFKTNWRKKYINYWEEIKKQEQNCG